MTADDIIKKMSENGGSKWAMHELNMTEEECRQMLDDAGKAECGGCGKIFVATDVDENGLCKRRCAPCEYCE